jgi:hypothetical protein
MNDGYKVLKRFPLGNIAKNTFDKKSIHLKDEYYYDKYINYRCSTS